MYVDADFLLALIKDEDWLADRAERIYRTYSDHLWTSQYALVELLLVAYRENQNVERVIANAANLIEIRGELEPVYEAIEYVVEYDLTPFDAIHLVQSGEEPIVSSDDSYDEFSERVALEPIE